MSRRRIIPLHGLKEKMPELEIGEFAFCTDTYECFVGSSEGNKELFHLEYLLTDLYLVSDIKGYKFKLSDESFKKLQKEYRINESGLSKECRPHCKECRDKIEGEIYSGNRCTDCWIAFLEAELELWIKRKTPDNSNDELLKENEKLKEQLEAKDRNINRLNLEAQRWFDIAMDELHK